MSPILYIRCQLYTKYSHNKYLSCFKEVFNLCFLFTPSYESYLVHFIHYVSQLARWMENKLKDEMETYYASLF